MERIIKSMGQSTGGKSRKTVGGGNPREKILYTKA